MMGKSGEECLVLMIRGNIPFFFQGKAVPGLGTVCLSTKKTADPSLNLLKNGLRVLGYALADLINSSFLRSVWNALWNALWTGAS